MMKIIWKILILYYLLNVINDYFLMQIVTFEMVAYALGMILGVELCQKERW